MEAVLLYDATCGFCAASVQFILERDRIGTLQFAALDSIFGRSVIAHHPELAGTDSVVWVDPSGQVFTHSTAVLRVAAYLGGVWRLAAIGWTVPRPIRDAVYRLIAKHRHQLTRQGPECFVPSPAERARFLQ
jgi:predicted DCC family thiol-disulfide oxidoreductase YuxK